MKAIIAAVLISISIYYLGAGSVRVVPHYPDARVHDVMIKPGDSDEVIMVSDEGYIDVAIEPYLSKPGSEILFKFGKIYR